MRFAYAMRVFVFSLLCVVSALAQTNCPGCFKNTSPLPGHGTLSNGRLIINIYIDPTLNLGGSGTNPKVWNAIAGAVQKWNNAQDADGNWTGYQFVVNQQGGPGNADILISYNNLLGLERRFGQCYPDSYPRKIEIATGPIVATNNDTDDLAALVAHEMGHAIGLDGSFLNPLCPSVVTANTTVVSPLYVDYTAIVHNVSPNDVRLANLYLYSPVAPNGERTHCTQNFLTSQGDPILGGGGDPDTGGDGGGEAPVCYFDEECVWQTIDPYAICVSGYCYTYSPILIDVTGDGYDLTDAEHGVSFDLLGNGSKIHISWTSSGSDDAWLALDRNGNGTIDDGTELFGTFTPQTPVQGVRNGFIALADFDTSGKGGNGDGRISSADAVFSRLVLWRDTNHNGISEPGELFKLPQMNVAAISLDYHLSKWTDMYANRFRYRATIERIEHTGRGKRFDWAFDVNLVPAK